MHLSQYKIRPEMKEMTLRKLISSREKWCQGAMARDSNGESVDETSDTAVSWCILGGINLICGCNGMRNSNMRETVERFTGVHCIINCNDKKLWAEVDRLLDEMGI